MKAVIYARVSTLEQDTERQVNELEKYAKDLQLEIEEIFTEKISGTIKQNKRPAFSAMLSYIKANDIKHVVCHELSRIGRNLRDTIDIIYDFMDDGICIHTLSERINTLNPDGSRNTDAVIRVGIFGSIAEMEVETLRNRTKSGLRNSKFNGGANGWKQPYGFKSVDRKLAIYSEEVKVVKIIYDKYLKGHSMNKIAQHLNDLHIPTKTNKRWVDKTISDILKNPLYKGERFHKGEQVPYNLEIIIPIENWEAVQALIRDKAIYNNRDSKNINLLKGIIFCGKCGEPLYMHRRKDLSDNVYKCLTSKTGYKTNSCGLRGINIDLLNIFATTITVASTNFNWDKFKDKAVLQHNITLQKIENLEKRIRELNSELSKLTTSFIKNIIKENIFIDLSKKYEDDIDKEINRIEQLKKQLRPIPERPKNIDINLSANNYIGEIQKFINKIEVSNIPLEDTPFNQRKDNIAYMVKFTVNPFGNHKHEIIHYVSSRDKRVFGSSWEPTMFNFDNAKRILI